MELCPNLVSLKVLGCSLDDDNENQYQQLRVLALEDDGESEWIDLFAKLPCLVVLSILGFPDVDTLDTFSQHCPSLKYVKYNEAPDNWVRWPYVWDASLDSGIQGLWIGDYADDLYYDGEALNDALLRTSKTLKHFHLEWSLDNNARAVPPAREIVFSHLASLSGQVDSESLLGFLVSMIDKAPKLETINLNLTWIDPTPIILMSSYHRLVNVHLVMKEEDQALDPLKTFLDAHPLLRSLSIGLWTQQCVQELLPRITKLTLLDELNIEFGHGTPLTTIINSVGHEMNITRLTLTGTESLNSIEEPIFSGLRFARSLKSLVIMVGSLTNMAALSLIELPSKVHIQMPLDGLNASVVKVLSRRFMNMKELEET